MRIQIPLAALIQNIYKSKFYFLYLFMLETTLYEELKNWWYRYNLQVPSFEICETDKKMAELLQTHPIVMAFNGLYHPIQYFCRLKENGVDTPTAKHLCSIYNNQFFEQASKTVRKKYEQ